MSQMHINLSQIAIERTKSACGAFRIMLLRMRLRECYCNMRYGQFSAFRYKKWKVNKSWRGWLPSWKNSKNMCQWWQVNELRGMDSVKFHNEFFVSLLYTHIPCVNLQGCRSMQEINWQRLVHKEATECNATQRKGKIDLKVCRQCVRTGMLLSSIDFICNHRYSCTSSMDTGTLFQLRNLIKWWNVTKKTSGNVSVSEDFFMHVVHLVCVHDSIQDAIIRCHSFHQHLSWGTNRRWLGKQEEAPAWCNSGHCAQVRPFLTHGWRWCGLALWWSCTVIRKWSSYSCSTLHGALWRYQRGRWEA